MTELELIIRNIGTESDLHEACQDLLRYFKLDFTEIAPSQLSPSDFMDEKFMESHKELIDKIDEIQIVGAATPDTFLQDEVCSLSREELESQLGNAKYEDMVFFSIEANSSMTRTEIAMLTRAFNRRFYYKPVVLFVRYNGMLSMTTCERSAYVRSGYDGEKVGKVTILHRINCAKPHPGHLNILDSLDIKGCTSFEEVYQKWLETFSNELLTKKFYRELSDWYAWAIKVVRFPNKLDDPNDDNKYNHENVIRLVTRLIFVWFLKEKHLIPEEFFDEKYIADNLIDGFAPNEQYGLFGYKSTESKYYKAILQNLFFATLNCPIADEDTGLLNNRRFCEDGADPDNAKLMRYKKYFIDPQRFIDLVNAKVPFLNGGLFDCIDDRKNNIYYDAFSDNEAISQALVVPDYLFFGETAGKNIDLSEFYGDENKKKVSARGIIDILSKYKFTIEENTPYEQEVSLDPELLGKVFENLLAAYNPETKTTARNQTGSFYTPREIVHYMVDESLVEHLKRNVGVELEPKFRALVSYSSEEIDLTSEQKKCIMQALYNCKILDPACGSGAFPVGMLQQMVHIISRIDPENEAWYELIKADANRQSSDAFDTESDDERNEKLEDIKQSFDQSKNYPDYARKLYLIENCIYGGDLQPIAIQISKLRFFISLVVDQKESHDPSKNFGIRPLPNLEAKFVSCNSLIPLEKNTDLFTSSDEEILALESRMHEANHKIFTAKSPQKKAAWRKILADSRTKMAATLVDKGYVSNTSSKMIASWNMFDQNSASEFFDMEWMFGISDGFDIVIGNPPYIQLEENEGKLAEFYKPYSFETFDRTGDIYSLFYERGRNLLKSGGILCFITSNKWMRNDSGEKTRAFLSSKTNPLQLVDFAGLQLFNNATVETNIMLFAREENQSSTRAVNISEMMGTVMEMVDYVQYNSTILAYVDSNSWVILTPKEKDIVDKVSAKSSLLGTWHIDINFGIKTGYNNAFIINSETRQSIIDSARSEEERALIDSIVRPVLRGRDTKRYKFNWSDQWLINTHNGIPGKLEPVDINAIPSIKRHLDSYIQKITNRSDKGRTPYHLRNCAYVEQFKEPKIIWGEISDRSKFCYDANGEYYCEATTFFMTGEISKFLLCYLNSKLSEFLFSKIATKTGMGTVRWKKYKIEQLMVPHVDDSIKKSIEDLYDSYVSTDDTSCLTKIDQLIYSYFGLTQEEIEIVEQL